MTTTPDLTTPLTDSVNSVPCTFCGSSPFDECVSALGRIRPTHRARWDSYRSARMTRQMWFVLLDDDPRFGLSAGDILRCVDYPYDAKVTVLFREEDGFDPECNQYLSSVAFLGFVSPDMAALASTAA